MLHAAELASLDLWGERESLSKLGLWQEVLELPGEYCVSPSFQEASIVYVVKCAVI